MKETKIKAVLTDFDQTLFNTSGLKPYYKNFYSTMEGKIYRKVSDYNRFHSDCKLITPLEAKEMYILTGYIPDFIK